jgi:putative glycosyltransferase (TIGR04372 family)
MNYSSRIQIVHRFRQLYWTITRAIGLSYVHGRENDLLKAFLKTVAYYSFYVAYPFCYFASKIIVLTNVRFLNAPDTVLSHIGHMSMDFDCYFKDQILSNRVIRTVLVGSTHAPANKALFALWSARMYAMKNGPLRRFLTRSVKAFPQVSEPITHYGLVMRGSSRAHLVQSRWGNREPLLSLDAALIARGKERLRRLGLPEGAWFVCVHAREPGYAPAHEWASTYRNSDILTYVDAMRLIVARGGWCIRVGDATMKPLPAIQGVIDYAISPFKEDWLDLFLCARCRFFLGSTSGLFGVAAIFGRPSALANVAPLSSVYSIFPNVISIPKLITDTDGNVLSFPEAFKDESSEFRYTAEFAARGLKHIDNTPEEILDLVAEMLDQTCDIKDVPDSELQARFRSLVRPNHYCWHSTAQVSDRFLQRHSELLVERQDMKTGSMSA